MHSQNIASTRTVKARAEQAIEKSYARLVSRLHGDHVQWGPNSYLILCEERERAKQEALALVRDAKQEMAQEIRTRLCD